MSETVDQIMERCPLKQDIRAAFWEPFIRRHVRRARIRKYLTLYSPPMMDIKHLQHRRLIDFDGETYHGVVAVTYIEEHYAAAISRVSGRPELMIPGDINELLSGPTTKGAKRLLDAFPFEVINLDYCDSLFSAENKKPISDHLRAITTLVEKQKKTGCNGFVLFLTTRAELRDPPDINQFSGEFLNDLARRIDDNRRDNPSFRRAFERGFNGNDGSWLRSNQYGAFIPIGLAKLISQIMGANGFSVREAAAAMLVRDERLPARWLLHLAFRVGTGTAPPPKKLHQVGAIPPYYHERRIAPFVSAIVDNQMAWLHEKADRERLKALHGADIGELVAEGVDLAIPESQ